MYYIFLYLYYFIAYILLLLRLGTSVSGILGMSRQNVSERSEVWQWEMEKRKTCWARIVQRLCKES